MLCFYPCLSVNQLRSERRLFICTYLSDFHKTWLFTYLKTCHRYNSNCQVREFLFSISLKPKRTTFQLAQANVNNCLVYYWRTMTYSVRKTTMGCSPSYFKFQLGFCDSHIPVCPNISGSSQAVASSLWQ